MSADIDRTETWVRFKSFLCDSCAASCCSLPVEVRLPDLVRMGVLDPFDLEEEPRRLAKRLARQGIIEHFNHKRCLFTLTRRANGECRYLDPGSRRCTIYDKRPDTCRNHPKIGPRPGFCAFRKK
ncbi:YkgJ family cysteine cluster protein [Paludibacterium paludis]|uniref:Zinc/iron-chelating domain-containing protein n=1 Tax=Paludibacterium paludis TaxID=1225769 RepID=A0A918P096_9NEIS|nr:YkgJ family cysteine cluster protein [Paludibacterium paludis]GGY10881.1 zinc/iron-chelating domain-containing protein [Paludibacterium paludis]